jgi:ribosomal protein L29
MKFKDIESKSVDDRQKLLTETKLELLKENAQVAVGTMSKNPGRIRQLKKTIARLNHIDGRN